MMSISGGPVFRRGQRGLMHRLVTGDDDDDDNDDDDDDDDDDDGGGGGGGGEQNLNFQYCV